MKIMPLIVAASVALAATAAFAVMDHESMPMDYGNTMKHEGMMPMGKMAHEGVVDGVKATFQVIDIQQKMKEMGMKETHHIMVMFTDAKTKKNVGRG